MLLLLQSVLCDVVDTTMQLCACLACNLCSSMVALLMVQSTLMSSGSSVSLQMTGDN